MAVVPPLPNELVVLIFERLWDSLCTNPHDQTLVDDIATAPFFHPLVLVCRAWASLARPFLMRRIASENPEAFLKVLRQHDMRNVVRWIIIPRTATGTAMAYYNNRAGGLELATLTAHWIGILEASASSCRRLSVWTTRLSDAIGLNPRLLPSSGFPHLSKLSLKTDHHTTLNAWIDCLHFFPQLAYFSINAEWHGSRDHLTARPPSVLALRQFDLKSIDEIRIEDLRHLVDAFTLPAAATLECLSLEGPLDHLSRAPRHGSLVPILRGTVFPELPGNALRVLNIEALSSGAELDDQPAGLAQLKAACVALEITLCGDMITREDLRASALEDVEDEESGRSEADGEDQDRDEWDYDAESDPMWRQWWSHERYQQYELDEAIRTLRPFLKSGVAQDSTDLKAVLSGILKRVRRAAIDTAASSETGDEHMS
ncbi:hypothetical protein Rhopal_005079-T1 [Rhodotorula paludigena]|uniref:F-box domain-containing protein n=1 Tax=Rhodotorula paludigena TaxID=86838 RepID=A0AAV5GRC6_9BASI|nr:hypothetical protein Rhopal_005079-T1 [Rhodotorula paludigena]